MAKRKMTVDDVLKFALTANPKLSPCGGWVVYEQTTIDAKEDAYRTELRLVSTQGGDIRVLTTAGSKNSSAAWSPDGSTLAFVSNRAYGAQVWLLPMDGGGEARQLTRFQYGFRSPKWSPDGRTVYGLVEVERNQSVKLIDPEVSSKEVKEANEKADEEFEKSPKPITRLRYKDDGEGWRRDRYQQLVAVDVATGEVRQLTDGPWHVGPYAVSPDGQHVAFVSNRTVDPDLTWWVSDVHRVSTAGGLVESLAEGLAAQSLSYSPDGAWLAVLGEGAAWTEFKSAAHTDLFVLPANGGDVRQLSAEFPDTLSHTNLSDVAASLETVPPTWSKDGEFIYVLSTREGRCEIVRFAAGVSVKGADNGEGFGAGVAATVVVGGDRDIYGFSFDGKDTFILSYGTPTNPSIIALANITGVQTVERQSRDLTEAMAPQGAPFFPANETRLDDSNVKLLSEVETVNPEAFFYTSQDGWQVEGWVIRPVGLQPGQKAPVLLEIHGGPQLNYGYMMFHEMQWVAAQGYAVVYSNPRGGMSYGQAFANGIRHHYGEGDAADVMNGLDAALNQFDFLDGTRVAVTGGSYGGFMTNWLVGHTNRFFAAVSQRSISNWISFFGVSDIGPLFCAEQHDIERIDEVEKLWKISPLAYVGNVQTPLLLIHSEKDLRCPIEQAEQFFTGIKSRGGEVEMFRIPNASHGLSRNGKPSLRTARLNAMFGFINDRLPPK